MALTRGAFTLTVITAVALAAGMRITGDGVDVFGLYGLAALLVLIGYGWAAGVAFRFRSIQAGPLMQTPVFLLLFLAPVYVPISLLKGWIHAVARVNPATAFLEAGRGLISGVHNHTGLAFIAAGVLIALFAVWMLSGPSQGRSSGLGAGRRPPGRFDLAGHLGGRGRRDEHPAQVSLAADRDRQAGDAAAHDEGFVEAHGAGDVVPEGQAQPDFHARAARHANRVLDHLGALDVPQGHGDVPHQAERLLPPGQPHLDRV